MATVVTTAPPVASAVPVAAVPSAPAPMPRAPVVSARGGFTAPCVVCLVLAGLCLVGAFSSPALLLGAAAFGGYAYYLYRGGRDFSGETADGRTRARAWIAWAVIAVVAAAVGFSLPLAFLVALLAAGYAVYLFSGGRDIVRQGHDGRQRSAVWLYYAAIATGAGVIGFAHPGSFLVALAAGAYSTYLYRGGRWVLWIW
jgi:hypothetical protein